jgi:hypothetical protein
VADPADRRPAQRGDQPRLTGGELPSGPLPAGPAPGDHDPIGSAPEARRHRRGSALVTGALLLLSVLVGCDEDAGTAVPVALRPVDDAPAGLAGPPRGPLAGDTGFVDAVRRLTWAVPDSGVPDPPLESRWVVFAGDVPGGRWALVVAGTAPAGGTARPGPPLLAAWFGGPADARPDELALQAPPIPVAPAGPVALLDQRTGTLVVVTVPGDVVEVSERPQVASDGTVFRTFRRLSAVDGIAVGRLRPSDVPVTGAAVYRVLRNGRTVAQDLPWTVGNRPGAALPVPIDHPRGPPSPAAELVVLRSAERLLAQLGLARHEITVTALWTGAVPGPGPEQGVAALVALPLPSGALLVDGEWLLAVESADGGYLQGGDCGLDVLPAGRPAEQRVFALACEVVDRQGAAPVRRFLVVVAPPEVAVVRVYDLDSRFLAEHATVDGVVVTPLARGAATVEAVSAAGINLGRTGLLGRGVDFLN